MVTVTTKILTISFQLNLVVSKVIISALQTALQKMKGNEDSEWKFAKTSLIMSYIKYGSKRYYLLKIITLNFNFDKDNLI